MKKSFAFLAFAAAVAVGSGSVQTASADSILQDNQRGSFLVFPKFDIRGETATQLRVTNYSSTYDIGIKLNYVCPGVKHVNDFCAALDTRFELTPNQTRVIDVADQNPPCNQGFVVAFAVGSTQDNDPSNNNTPVSFNSLGGSYHVSEGRRLESENAIAIESTRDRGTTLGSGTPRVLRFGGGDYLPLGTDLYTDFLAVDNGEPASGSKITLLTLDVLAGAQNPAALVAVNFWNAAEVPYSSSLEFICWTEKQLDAVDANFLEDNLGSTYGSLKLAPVGNCPIPGGCPPLQNFYPTLLGAIEEYGDGVRGGRTMLHDGDDESAEYRPR